MTVAVEAGHGEDDVVDLPLPRRQGGVDLRRGLTINRGRLAVGVRAVVVAVEHLDLVESLEKDAAVAAFLTVTARRRGFGELDVNLHVAEFLERVDAAAVGDHGPVGQLPCGWVADVVRPRGEVVAVEEDHGVGRGASRGVGGGERAGSDHGGLGPVGVVNVPGHTGQQRSFLVALDGSRRRRGGLREDGGGAREEQGRASEACQKEREGVNPGRFACHGVGQSVTRKGPLANPPF